MEWIINIFSDLWTTLWYGLAILFLSLIYWIGFGIQVIYSALFGLFSSTLFTNIFNAITTIAFLGYILMLILNEYQNRLNGFDSDRKIRGYFKSIFGFIVLVSLPTIISFINSIYNSMLKAIMGVTGEINALGTYFVNMAIQISYADNKLTSPVSDPNNLYSVDQAQVKTVCNITLNQASVTYQGISQTCTEAINTINTQIINDNPIWYLQRAKVPDTGLGFFGESAYTYPINWFLTSLVSILLIVLMIALLFKISKKIFEMYEWYFLLPLSTLSFTKDGGSFFTRTLMGFLQSYFAILLFFASLSILSASISQISSLIGKFTPDFLSTLSAGIAPESWFLLFIVCFGLIHVTKGNNKIMQLLETDGVTFNPSVPSSIKSGGRGFMEGATGEKGKFNHGITAGLGAMAGLKTGSHFNNQKPENKENQGENGTKKPKNSNLGQKDNLSDNLNATSNLKNSNEKSSNESSNNIDNNNSLKNEIRNSGGKNQSITNSKTNLSSDFDKVNNAGNNFRESSGGGL